MTTTRHVRQLREALPAFVRPGDVAIDATAGNGKDTVALAELAGDAGRVFAFDIQPAALANTAARLRERGIGNVVLLERDHAEMRDALPAELAGTVAAVTFNLGFLPGGDRSIVTRTASTLAAMRAATELLRPGGLLAVMAYRGHADGSDEADAVAVALGILRDAGWDVTRRDSLPGPKPGPTLWLAVKPNPSRI